MVSSVTAYRRLTVLLVHSLLTWSRLENGEFTTYESIANKIGLSKSQFSKVVNGVCSLSGPCFARLCVIVGDRQGEHFLFQTFKKNLFS